MGKIIVPLLVIGGIGAAAFFFLNNKMNKKTLVEETVLEQNGKSIHSLKAKTLIGGEEKSLAQYQGNAMLIVNTASKCGLTPQYKELQALHETYSSKGLSVLGFPSNDFMKQEPGSHEEIAAFCQKNYGVEFDMFEKVKVKGEGKHPVYEFLTSQELNGVQDSEVQWNFQKYLLDKEGRLVAIFNPRVSVEDEEFISKLNTLL